MAARRGRPLRPLELSLDTRAELELLAHSRTLPHGQVSRAHLVLPCADGVSNAVVAEMVGLTRATVGKWRKRFRQRVLRGLYDERRSGRPRTVKDEKFAALLRKTLRTKPKDGSPAWSYRAMSAEITLSKSTVQRVWSAFGAQPHGQQHFKLSTDPFVAEKAHDIAGLYLNLPDHAMVSCVDEKS